MSRYWIDVDGSGDLTIWHETDNLFGPDPIVRQCDVTPDAWALMACGVESTNAVRAAIIAAASDLDDIGRGCAPEYANWLRARADRMGA